ncbi:MAG: DUF3494 domain-containing protein [Thermoleophilia bacterium]|nr:DUF3494 domain-containing protein [Thermoleophilia bacterium]
MDALSRNFALTGGAKTIAGLFAIVWLVALTSLASDARAAQPTVGLGTADGFAVLAGSTVTNTGPSTLNGDLGLSPGSSVTGFPPGTVNGAIHVTDAVAGQAQTDTTTAYNDAAGRTPALSVAADLGGLTLSPGVFKSGSSLGLTGDLTLNAQGNPDAVFIFQAGSALTTASGSRVNLINGAQACNVFWQIGSSATLGTTSVFAGNILALTSIELNNGVTLNGRALARNGAVTLINDTISAAHCAAGTSPGGTNGTSPGGTNGKSPGGTNGSHNGTALLTTLPHSVATTIATDRCVDTRFRASVRGLFIRRVVFSIGGRVVATRSKSPFTALVQRFRGGSHTVKARVTFTDGTPAVTLRMRFVSCAAARSQPPRGPVGLTG